MTSFKIPAQLLDERGGVAPQHLPMVLGLAAAHVVAEERARPGTLSRVAAGPLRDLERWLLRPEDGEYAVVLSSRMDMGLWRSIVGPWPLDDLELLTSAAQLEGRAWDGVVLTYEVTADVYANVRAAVADRGGWIYSVTDQPVAAVGANGRRDLAADLLELKSRVQAEREAARPRLEWKIRTFAADDVEGFLRNAETKAERGAYGPYGLLAFMAAYHGNVVANGRPTALAAWGDYANLLAAAGEPLPGAAGQAVQCGSCEWKGSRLQSWAREGYCPRCGKDVEPIEGKGDAR